MRSVAAYLPQAGRPVVVGPVRGAGGDGNRRRRGVCDACSECGASSKTAVVWLRLRVRRVQTQVSVRTLGPLQPVHSLQASMGGRGSFFQSSELGRPVAYEGYA